MKVMPQPVASARLERERNGFTLVELLVIIGLLALLATIQVSAYAGARWRTRKAVCASNVRKLTLVLHLYGADSDSKLPIGSDGWPWELPPTMTGEMLSYGLHKRDFYCPSTAPQFTDWENFLAPGVDPYVGKPANLWDYFSDGYHITGYVYALSGGELSSSNQNTTLLAEPIKTGPFTISPTLPPPPNSERVLVADSIISQPGQNNPTRRLTGGYNYTDITGGFYKHHLSAHLNGSIPEGSNLGFKDGHVAWRKFSDEQVAPRTRTSPPFWW